MKSIIRRIARIVLFSLAALVAVIVIYIGAAFVGGLVPAGYTNFVGEKEETVEINLLSTLLHVDIAIPVDDVVRERFSFLLRDGFPLEHEELEYIVIGWGSRAFYPPTKALSDIRLGPTLTAITSDDAVLHLLPAKDVSQNPNATSVTMSAAGYAAMLDSILDDFKLDAGRVLKPLENASHGQGDLFYESKGHFNIFHPCNVWVAKKLRKGGVSTGIWTPTSQSLIMSLSR